MASCNKRSYAFENLALDALINARINFGGNTAVNFYQCISCGAWHLTSQGSIHPNLATALANGQIKKQQESENWERKFRR
jgi:hypothetical protein